MYDIGTYVMVHRRLGRTKPGSGIVIWASIVLTKPRLGQVVGMKRVYDGRIMYGFGDEQGYFAPSKTHTVYLVRYGMLNKAVCVEEQGMRPATIEEVEELPKVFTQRSAWSAHDKQVLSSESKCWERDAKGRWV